MRAGPWRQAWPRLYPPPVPTPATILVTRPEPGAAETARRLAALGHTPVLAPALVLAARPLDIPPATQAVLLTSRAAARALPPTAVPVLAVGEATAAEARARGCTDVRAAEGDAAALARLCAATLSPAKGPLLLAVGAGYAQDLAAALRAAGFRVLRRIAYAVQPAEALPGAALAALRHGDVTVALFFSPRSAECAIALLRRSGVAATAGGITALALSARVAAAATAALAPLSWRAVQVAARPDQESLLALLPGV